VIKQISNIKGGFESKATPLATRNMKTNLVLKNGDTAIIGGLMKDEETEVTQKVPVLGDLPVLGWLFKSKNVVKTKVNMLVFLTPTIIRNSEGQQQMVLNKTNDRLDFLKKNGGKDPYGSTVDKILKRSVRAPQSVKDTEDN
jgi:general secretion pathway protein D